jgi:hypothetical protein
VSFSLITLEMGESVAAKQDEIKAYAKKFYPSCTVEMNFRSEGGPFVVYVRADGSEMYKPYCEFTRGDNIDKVFNDAEHELGLHIDAQQEAAAKNLAMKLIEITDAQGYCSDRDLRLAGFPEAFVKNHKAEAESIANRAADKGPFVIDTTEPGNGQPDIVPVSRALDPDEVPF